MLGLRVTWQQWMRRDGLRLATVAGVLTFLTACTVGLDSVRPTVMAPIAYKEMNGWKVAQPKDDVIREVWWEVFADRQVTEQEKPAESRP